MAIPDTVFIVPYRDRPKQKADFDSIMKDYLTDRSDYLLLYIEQKDQRPFNRGAMKNIGFLTVREMFPDDYRDINLVFHDVDTWPRWKGQFSYRTTTGRIVHHYGNQASLGGIVVIKAGDFERTSGYANFWGWGMEDNVLQDRCIAAKLTLDRSSFYPMNSRSVTRAFDGYKRMSSKTEAAIYKFGTPDTMWDLRNVRKAVDLRNNTVDVIYFEVPQCPEHQRFVQHDIRHGSRLVANRKYLPNPHRNMFS